MFHEDIEVIDDVTVDLLCLCFVGLLKGGVP